ncbi:MAG: class I SAM-dependent methyltransferase [Candidatus Sericytochromatia bacterium]|nr:class I SAM-dependent methyltransferase [Candidatus Sericytochromatia bacterium]
MELATQRIEDEVGSRHWWFEGRRAILRSLLAGEGLPRGACIYDVGCGTGQNLEMLAAFGEVTGVDRSAEVGSLARARGWQVVQGDVVDLPLPADSADVMVAMDVLEHLDDDGRAARELFRVLRPGGLLVVTVPAFRWLWGSQDDVSHHRRRYTRPELEALLTGAGFVLHKVSYFNFFLFLPIWLGRRLVALLGRRVLSENTLTPPWLDRPLGAIFASEACWLRRLEFPVGVSLLALGRKPAQPERS